MQYLLTEQEFHILCPKEEVGKLRVAIRRMRELLIKNDCIHIPGGPEYCSGCKLSALGGKRDEDRPTPEESKLMCDRSRSYPQ